MPKRVTSDKMSLLLQLWKRKFRNGAINCPLTILSLALLTLVVCLVQPTELVPLSRPNHHLQNPTPTELLIDPIYQSEREGLQSKRVVAKSIVNTVLITTPPEGPQCEPGSQQVTPGGPCRQITSGVKVDEKVYLDQLRQLAKEGLILNNKKVRNCKNRRRGCNRIRNRNRNKNKSQPAEHLDTAVIYEDNEGVDEAVVLMDQTEIQSEDYADDPESNNNDEGVDKLVTEAAQEMTTILPVEETTMMEEMVEPAESINMPQQMHSVQNFIGNRKEVITPPVQGILGPNTERGQISFGSLEKTRAPVPVVNHQVVVPINQSSANNNERHSTTNKGHVVVTTSNRPTAVPDRKGTTTLAKEPMFRETTTTGMVENRDPVEITTVYPVFSTDDSNAKRVERFPAPISTTRIPTSNFVTHKKTRENTDPTRENTRRDNDRRNFSTSGPNNGFTSLKPKYTVPTTTAPFVYRPQAASQPNQPSLIPERTMEVIAATTTSTTPKPVKQTPPSNGQFLQINFGVDVDSHRELNLAEPKWSPRVEMRGQGQNINHQQTNRRPLKPMAFNYDYNLRFTPRESHRG